MICDICQKNPAVYGDGVTWKRCSECELKQRQFTEPQEQSPIGDGTPHQTVEGLTSIIMPIYNVGYHLFHYTGNAIGSIREHTDESYELIVVDNGSPIQPPNLNAYYADKVIKNEKNEGFTKAVNQGIRASFGEYIVILNNDTQVFDGWLTDIKRSLEKLDLVMSYPMYSLTEPFARATEAMKIRLVWDPKPIEESFSDFRDFSCVGFKKSLIDEIGLFNEEFFNYASDSEFLDRLKANGKKFASSKKIAIHHISDATGASINETPEIMNQDKAKYAGNTQKVEATNPPKPISDGVPLKDGVTVRSKATGDKVFLIKDQKYHWIKNIETLKALGFNLGQEKFIEFAELQQYEKGEDLTVENVEKFKA